MGVAIKIRYTPQSPAGRKSRAVRAADENVVVKIPYRCLTRPGITEHPFHSSTCRCPCRHAELINLVVSGDVDAPARYEACVPFTRAGHQFVSAPAGINHC